MEPDRSLLNWSIEAVAAEDTFDVRHPVLRKGRPRGDCRFPGDELEETLHLLGKVGTRPMAVATFLPREHAEFAAVRPYQLRGMAVLDIGQGQGWGRKLLLEGEARLRAGGCDLLWMNARSVALGFYEKMGYRKRGTEFEIEGFGPHLTLYKPIMDYGKKDIPKKR